MDSFYHVWFSTKGRKEALEGPLGDDAKRLLMQTAERTGIRLLEVEIVADHAHLLLALDHTQSLPSVMRQLKGATARYIFLKYRDLKVDMGHTSFWQKGYGWRRVSQDELPTVRTYIRTQRQRPLRGNS